MQTFLECVPCFVRQTLDAARMATDDEGIHERIMRAVLAESAEMSFSESPPRMGLKIHRLIRELSGNPDPYRELKQRFTRLALEAYDDLKERVRASDKPFETAVRLAIAGNIIDFGVLSWQEDCALSRTIEDTLRRPFGVNDLKEFQEAVAKASSILYLGDNAGETVFDRILIEELPAERVTFVVKGGPVINDATVEDARAAGITGIVEVVDNGSDAPGTILETCSEQFRNRFDAADLIIAKGQGNYETMSDCGREQVFFLLKVKCPVIARDIGCEVGGIVVQKKPE